MQLRQTRGRAVESSARQDVGQRRLAGFSARPGILRHVAERSAAQHKAARGIVFAGEHLEQGRFAGPVAPDQSDLVTRTDGEARVGQDPARGDVDGEVADLEHDGMLRAGRIDVLSHIKRPGGRSK